MFEKKQEIIREAKSKWKRMQYLKNIENIQNIEDKLKNKIKKQSIKS